MRTNLAFEHPDYAVILPYPPLPAVAIEEEKRENHSPSLTSTAVPFRKSSEGETTRKLWHKPLTANDDLV